MAVFLNCSGPGKPVLALRCHIFPGGGGVRPGVVGLGREGTSRDVALNWYQAQILGPFLLPLLCSFWF